MTAASRVVARLSPRPRPEPKPQVNWLEPVRRCSTSRTDRRCALTSGWSVCEAREQVKPLSSIAISCRRFCGRVVPWMYPRILAAVEPSLPSVSARSKSTRDMGVRLYVLVGLLVVVGLLKSVELPIKRSSPRFLPAGMCTSSAGIPSRKLRSAGPRPGREGGAPYWTNDLLDPGAVWWPPVRDGSWWTAGHPRAAGVQGASSPGRRRLSPGRRAGGPARRRLAFASSTSADEIPDAAKQRADDDEHPAEPLLA